MVISCFDDCFNIEQRHQTTMNRKLALSRFKHWVAGKANWLSYPSTAVSQFVHAENWQINTMFFEVKPANVKEKLLSSPSQF